MDLSEREIKLNEFSLDRMARAVGKARDRLLRVPKTLEEAVRSLAGPEHAISMNCVGERFGGFRVGANLVLIEEGQLATIHCVHRLVCRPPMKLSKTNLPRSSTEQ